MGSQVVLFSGGMDSLALAHAYPDATLLYVLSNTESAQHEQTQVSKIGNALHRHIEFRRCDLSWAELPNYIVPFRNSVFALLGFQYGPEVLLGSTEGDTTKDKDDEWARLMSTLVAHMSEDPSKCPPRWITSDLQTPRVLVPFRAKTKTEVLKEYLSSGGSQFAMSLSHSCYSGKSIECGNCRSCFRKWVAFHLCGVSELLRMDKCPRDSEYVPLWLSKDRGRETAEARSIL